MDGVELLTEHVARAYGDRLVVEGANVRMVPGRLHAVVGENGAGKSTLLKMIAGVVTPTRGRVLVGGRPLEPATPREATARGVGMVHQHFSLVEALTGLENLMLGDEPVGRFGRLEPSRLRARADEVMSRTGLRVALDVPVGELGVAQRQRLEIVRVMTRGARALLLDEPTAVLPRGEAHELYRWLRSTAAAGATVGVVTHHLDEVTTYADDVTVMRGGRVLWQGAARGASVDSLASIALGALPAVSPPAALAPDAPIALALSGAHTSPTDEASVPLRGASLTLRAGEVVGVAGVDANGQDALALALAGLLPLTQGSLALAGRDLTHARVAARRAAGVEVIYGDRHRRGFLPEASVADNLVLGEWPRDEASVVSHRLAASGAMPPDPAAAAGSLSGGNQQKLVVARALDRRPRVLVATYPTRGVDAAAAATMQGKIAAAAADGAAVVLVSSELSELRALAHRLVVMVDGAFVTELPTSASEAEIGRAMLGGRAP